MDADPPMSGLMTSSSYTGGPRTLRRLAAVLLLAVLAGVAPGSSAHAASAGAEETLRDRVNSALRGSTASVVGVRVLVSGFGTVVSRRSTTSLPPASTQKMYVGLTALQKLTPGLRLRTSVRATALPDADGVLRGHITLRGTGDPTLRTTHLTKLAKALRARGVVRVTGYLYGDDTYFDRARRAPGWKASFVPVESGPLSALVLNGNRWRKDAAYLKEPVLPNVGRFRSALKAEGITVVGGNRLGMPPAPTQLVAAHYSPTVGTLVRWMLKDSYNMTAELLLKRIGAQAGSAGSTAGGARVVNAYLAELGVLAGTTADGSGLSSYDRKTPAGEVALLRAAERTAYAGQFQTSLSRACIDGTLEERMCGTAAAGRVYAKTGTLYSSRVLAGYTTTRSGRRVWFSFMLTGCSSGLSCRNAIDRAVVQLAAFSG